MPKYKVDKKQFDQRILEEQLLQVELQSKYLRDEPLRRSEVDEYNKLRANGWVKNTLISLGVLFATAVAIVIFILLGNMLMTNGRTGDVGIYDLDSSAIYSEFKNSEYFPEPSLSPTFSDTVFVDYPVPESFLVDPNHEVYITYRLEWRQSYDLETTQPLIGEGTWVFSRDKDGSIGNLTMSTIIGADNNKYDLDAESVNLNQLMTNWFMSQEDGWAKTMIKDYFYSAWPLTLVLWLVFILAIVGYATVLLVGIRYLIRTVIVILRRAGYIASDFAKEVVDTVKSEIPIVEAEPVEEISFEDMKERVESSMRENRDKFQPIGDEELVLEPKEDKPLAVEEKISDPSTKVIEKPVVEDAPKKESKAKEQIKDIYNM